MTGRTVNLLNCPLYKPLIGNGNISQTLLDHEIPWSAERASEATMPRPVSYTHLSSNIGTSDLQGREAYRFGTEPEYNAIRYAWIYIENADRIPDITSSARRERVAEAKVIIALAYAEMLRYMGGVPLLKHSVAANEEMHYPRNTFCLLYTSRCV